MAFVIGRILSKDGEIIFEHGEIWSNVFRFGTQLYWDGSFEAPVVPALNAPAYRIHLADGREGTITHLTRWLKGDNIMVYFQGNGPLAARA